MQEEHLKLKAEINDIKSKILLIKEEIYFLYKSTELNDEEVKELLVPYGKLRKSLRKPENLTAAFILRNFAEVTIEDEFIVINFPFSNDDKYGFRFEKKSGTDVYDLVRCFLPYTLNPDQEIKKGRALTLAGIAEYIQTTKRNIYAYYMRKVQFEELESIVKSSLYFVCNISPCCTHLSINCYYAAEKNVKHLGRVIDLKYNELEILPLQIKVNGTVNDDLMVKCSVFQEELLAGAYKKLTEQTVQWLHLLHDI